MEMKTVTVNQLMGIWHEGVRAARLISRSDNPYKPDDVQRHGAWARGYATVKFAKEMFERSIDSHMVNSWG